MSGINRLCLRLVLAAGLLAALLPLASTAADAAVPERLDGYLVAYDPGQAAVEVIGPIGPGIAERLREELNAHPEAKWVHLSSPGGLVIEGRRLRDLINARHLDTYVRTACVSACTLAFIGGKQRVVRRNAVFGFHQYSSFLGQSLQQYAQDADRSFFRGRGVSEAFVARMFEAKHSELLTVTADEAVTAQVATAATDRFTAPPLAFFPADLAAEVRKSIGHFAPFYEMLQRYEPDRHYQSVIVSYELALSGESKAAERAGDLIGSEMSGRLLPTTSNEAARAMARALAALYTDLRGAGARQCVAGLAAKRSGDDDWEHVSAATLALVVEAYVMIVRDAHERPQARLAGSAAEGAIEGFARAIVEDWNYDDITFVSDPARYGSDPERACRLLIAYFQLLSELPADQGGRYFRASAAAEE